MTYMDVMLVIVTCVVALVLVGVWIWFSMRSFEREAQEQQRWREARAEYLHEKFGISKSSRTNRK